ncbi:ABC transporter substrate-binding protein [Thioclava sp. GXIMD2076]|uniref:ABC transporter substrate-binding protein n=1 Tax=Thioclava kandeliae TaxID=3070818 RepID=A0ABV1SF27_9RHOB
MTEKSRFQLSRRRLLGQAAGAALATPFLARMSFAASDTIRIGNILDMTGPIGPGGQAVAPGMELAVKHLNDKGGVLGRQIELVNYDTQSNMQLYTQYAQQLALKDKVDVVFGGLTSASREAIRPIFDRFKTLYFYNVLYEGGVCDRNTFCTGTTPAQTVLPLVEDTAKRFGKKVYIIAADYNYGHITAKWMQNGVLDNGGEVVGTDFFPLDVTNFSSAIARIQAANPDYVLAALVGANHLGFYRQWEAAGLLAKIPLASSNFGVNSEIITLEPQTTNGIVAAGGYFDSIDTPESNAFLEEVTPMLPPSTACTEITVSSYEAMMLYAQALEKAGTTDRMKVIEALESGLEFVGPSGKVTLDPKTHHTVRSAFIAEAKDGKWDIQKRLSDVAPADTAAVCDLIANPKTNKQFVVDTKM